MCCNFHLGYVGKIDEYVSDKFFKNQKLDLDNFTHFHNFNLWKQPHDRTRLSAAIFRKTSSLRGILGRFFIGPSSVEEPWCWKWRAPPRMQSSPPGLWNNFVGLKDPWKNLHEFHDCILGFLRGGFSVFLGIFLPRNAGKSSDLTRIYVSNGWFHCQL